MVRVPGCRACTFGTANEYCQVQVLLGFAAALSRRPCGIEVGGAAALQLEGMGKCCVLCRSCTARGNEMGVAW